MAFFLLHDARHPPRTRSRTLLPRNTARGSRNARMGRSCRNDGDLLWDSRHLAGGIGCLADCLDRHWSLTLQRVPPSHLDNIQNLHLMNRTMGADHPLSRATAAPPGLGPDTRPNTSDHQTDEFVRLLPPGRSGANPEGRPRHEVMPLRRNTGHGDGAANGFASRGLLVNWVRWASLCFKAVTPCPDLVVRDLPSM